MITLNYTLGVYPAYNGTVAKLSQYDSDFTLVFTLTNDYGDFVLESGTTAQIRGTKADGNGYSAECAIDIEAQTVTVTGDEQLTAAAGDNTFEIRLIKDGKILNTVNFIIWVERAALDAGTITSESVLLDLTAIIESAETARQAATDAAASADEAAASAATLKLDPTLTKSGESADAKVVGDALTSGLAARHDSASPYAVGDYFLKDNILYHVTKAIPAGGTVTVGTNVEIAPLGNAVNALNSNLTDKLLPIKMRIVCNNASTDTIHTLGYVTANYGSFLIALRTDTASDGAWFGLVRHNSAGWQISEIYKGSAVYTPYVNTDGSIKTSSASNSTVHGMLIALATWS